MLHDQRSAGIAPQAIAPFQRPLRVPQRQAMDPTTLGQHALVGWRKKVADALADPVADRTPLTSAQARGLVGALFLALSLYYVVSSARRMARELLR